MSSENTGTGARNDFLQQPLSLHLDDCESVEQTLTNTRVGVTRIDGESTTIEPVQERGAVAAVTDKRLLFAVGREERAERGTRKASDDDFTASITYDALEAVEKRTETLTQSLVVEAADGVTWEFTAREPSAVDTAIECVEQHMADHELAVARGHHEAAEDAGDAARRAEELEAALDAYQSAAELLGTDKRRVTDAERAAREDAEAVIATLVTAHRDHGAQSKAAAEWEFAADNTRSADELFVDAREAYDRALELARAYPPGDPETIERERNEVVEAMEPLTVESAVADATGN
ncbi:hypothetical protein BRC91_02215 [Halobacteriales archaeon QS_4_62_28]|nr:MAG: hypothetical protein BRC91_02215 [Halobacteriales archaeon QS_4_62_28]